MYKIVGADQKEYGPVPTEQILQWIKDGRANGQTLARLEDGPWKPLATFPEFAAVLPSVPPPLTPAIPLSNVSPEVLRANRFAIAGLCCSVFGLFCCGPILASVGLLLSCIGLVQINQKPLLFSGSGLAWAGILIALLDFLLLVLLIRSGAVLERILRYFPH